VLFFQFQNIDSLVSVVNSSRNFIPLYELPLLLGFGLQTDIQYFYGCITTIPPPTPLLPGKPTLKENSPGSS
jgi:hypothetical protein